MIPDAKGFIFDLDGTLLSLPVDWEGVRSELRSVLKGSYEFRAVFPTLDKIVAENPGMRDSVFGTVDRFELVAAPKVALHDGSEEVLELLRRRSCLLSLVTMQGGKVRDYLFRSFNLGRYFSSSFTRDISLDRVKQLELALAEMKLQSRNVIFVGDRLNDLVAARKVGVWFIFVRGRPDISEKDVCYANMRELLTVLQSNEQVKLLR